ncbi:uncharacterized protein LOC111041651 [Myzus persicae]|uniref:uncharacterized protein LOC111041651 n=1 Tax=Myzus persicae TaxID=13164 RepID=UPI000B9308CB|nr:uncharacterized protein LOC111041651 [Myzus persicae]
MRHEKTHEGIRFPCTICTSTFSNRSHMNRHIKTVHEFASNILESGQPAGPLSQSVNVNYIPFEDFNDGYDEICLEVLENAQDAGLCDATTHRRPQRGEIKIAPNIIVSDQPAGPSSQSVNVNIISCDDFNDGYDEIGLEIQEDVQDAGLCDATSLSVIIPNTVVRS